MALSAKLNENELCVLDKLELNQIKTKEFNKVINVLDKRNVLLVTDAKDEKIERSSRNLPDVKVLRCEGLNVYDILKYKNIILLESAVQQIEGRLAG